MPRTSPRFRALVSANTATASWAARLLVRATLLLALPSFCIAVTCVLPMLGMGASNRKVRRVCDRARVGQPVAPVIDYAHSLHLIVVRDTHETHGRQHTLIEARAHGSTCYCDLTHRDGVVVSKRIWGHFPWQ